jgi:O-antigen ligase
VISGVLFDKKYFKFALIILMVIIGFDKVLNIGRSDPGKVLEDSSILYRVEIWKACFRIIRDNKITGIGFGTLSKYITSYSDVVKPNIEHCHNLYIQILTETGVIGLSGFLFVLINLIKNLWCRIKQKNNQGGVTSCTIIVMVLIHSIGDSVFLTPQIMMILSIYTGVILGKERNLCVPKSYKNFSFITFQ